MESMHREPIEAFIGLGANLGDPRASILDAFEALKAMPGLQGLRRSSLWVSAPLDAAGPDYVNAVACLHTRLTAPELLEQLQSIETSAGRVRPYRNAPRTLDLDLLLYGAAFIDSATLKVPHPRMWDRAFVLLPLAELAGHLVPSQVLQAVKGQQLQRLDS